MKDGASPITVTVDKIVEHPEYKPDSSSNDMALLRLKNPVNFTGTGLLGAKTDYLCFK